MRLLRVLKSKLQRTEEGAFSIDQALNRFAYWLFMSAPERKLCKCVLFFASRLYGSGHLQSSAHFAGPEVAAVEFV